MVADDAEIVVVGAGVIGLCIALRLQGEGRDVLLVDRAEPGSGASCGNAGVLATYECVPLGTPSVLKALPRLLFDPASPLSISISALPRLAPWLIRFVRSSTEGRAVRHAVALATLLQNSLSAYLPLLEQSGALTLLRRQGALHVFRTQEALRTAEWEKNLRRRLGIALSVLDGAGLADLEPTLPHSCHSVPRRGSSHRSLRAHAPARASVPGPRWPNHACRDQRSVTCGQPGHAD